MESLAGGTAAELWKRGFDALNQSTVLRKQETTQRVTAIAWAILAANRLGERDREALYREEFGRSGADQTIAGRFPLYFSPFTMKVVPFENLETDLNRLPVPVQ
jgi:hypothetical protein